MRSLIKKRRKQKIKKIIRGFMKFVLTISPTLLLTKVSWSLLSRLAAAERGYTNAIGGEGLLILLIFYLSFSFFDVVVSANFETSNQKMVNTLNCRRDVV